MTEEDCSESSEPWPQLYTSLINFVAKHSSVPQPLEKREACIVGIRMRSYGNIFLYTLLSPGPSSSVVRVSD